MRKINFGIVSILVLILAFTFFFVIKGVVKKKDIEKAKIFTEDYLNISNSYILLKEEDRDIEKKISKSKYTEYIESMKNELSKYIVESQQEAILSKFEKVIEQQCKGKLMFKKYDVKITSFNKNADMTDDIITLNYDYTLTIEAVRRKQEIFNNATNRYIGNVENVEMTVNLNSTILVRKEGKDNYKIVYQELKTDINEFIRPQNFMGVTI